MDPGITRSITVYSIMERIRFQSVHKILTGKAVGLQYILDKGVKKRVRNESASVIVKVTKQKQ